MDAQGLIQWLLEEGGPTIRYRTAKELVEPADTNDLGKMSKELAYNEEVRGWLERFDPLKVNQRTYHGSADTCFENVLGKLVQLGMHAGMAPLDEKTEPVRNWVVQMFDAVEEQRDVFALIVITSFLAFAGYEDRTIETFLNSRLQVLYEFARNYNYDIYDDSEKYKGIPEGFRGSPIIRPELYRNGNYRYPLIYDIYGLTTLINKYDEKINDKISTVINYILSAGYHRTVVDRYGILAAPNGKYYSMGWDAKVPGFFEIDDAVMKKGASLLQRMELMAHFPMVSTNSWFRNALEHLETYRTERGTYSLPKQYLGEKEGYYVCGMHMGLGENRRQKTANELESTFWILKIKKSAGMI